MTPTRLSLTTYAGQSRTVRLTPTTLIAAPNGSGKTTLLEALHLCTTARYPGADRPPTLDEARERGPKWALEAEYSDGSMVSWTFSGSSLVPAFVAPGRMPPKGKDATIAAIEAHYGAAVTLHAADLATLDPEGLARWIVSLCTGAQAAGSALTPEAAERMLGAGSPAPRPGESTLGYLDRCAVELERQAGEARSRKRSAEVDPTRKAVASPPAPGALEAAEAKARDAETVHAAALTRLGEVRGRSTTAREAWERENQGRASKIAGLESVKWAAAQERQKLAAQLDALPPVPADPGPEPARAANLDDGPRLTEEIAKAREQAARLDSVASGAFAQASAVRAGKCPTCGREVEAALTETLETTATEARAKADNARRVASELTAQLEKVTTETWKFNSALAKWAAAVESRKAAEALRADFAERIKAAADRVEAARVELEALGESPVRPDAGPELAALVEEVSLAEAARDAAQETAGALRTAQRVADDLTAKRERAEAAIETEREILEDLKATAALAGRLRTQAVGQAVGPFVAAVNAQLGGALGELVVDLAPVARVGFRRGESFVPVRRLSGMESARWLAACAVAAAGLAASPCQVVLLDDVDRLTETPRQALLEMLGEAVAMGDLGGCVLALAWEPADLPEGTGWDVIGL